MNKHDEERLYLWVRVFGAIVLLITIAIATLALVLLPLVNPDYKPEAGALVVIIGTLGTAALALVGVELRLRRNDSEPAEKDEKVEP